MSTTKPTAELTGEEQDRRGELIAINLGLRRDRDYRDRWVTGWGTKTSLGLFRMLNRIILDGE